MYCRNCKQFVTQDPCELCGNPIEQVVDDKMDDLVRHASIPNLGALVTAGQQAGLIKPVPSYGD